jgi:CheY-like chemotaxis protein
LPVLVLSNAYLTKMMQEASDAGATKCLSKSNCTPRQVLEMVRTALSGPPNAIPVPAPAGDSSVAALRSAVRGSASALPGSHVSAAEAGDVEIQSELRRSLVAALPATLAGLRALHQALVKSNSEAARADDLQELIRRVQALTGKADLAGLSDVARLADALDALLQELHNKPKTINDSTLRTVALAVDCLGFLFDRDAAPPLDAGRPPNILVVDDEAMSRRAVRYALEKARLKSTSVEGPAKALELLSGQQFDLVLLDIDMPGINGFELCTKLRAMPAHRNTPVAFVTRFDNFEIRASSAMSGGNDLIVKPFLFMELAVKALVHVLRSRAPAREGRARRGG